MPFEANIGADGRYLSAGDIRDAWLQKLSGRSPSSVVHMCGSGVTACVNVLAMEHAGLAGTRLYAGSWSEWISDPSRPVAVGGE